MENYLSKSSGEHYKTSICRICKWSKWAAIIFAVVGFIFVAFPVAVFESMIVPNIRNGIFLCLICYIGGIFSILAALISLRTHSEKVRALRDLALDKLNRKEQCGNKQGDKAGKSNE